MLPTFEQFRVDLMPTAGQIHYLLHIANACHIIYNEALIWQMTTYLAGERPINLMAMDNMLTEWREGEAPLPTGRHASWLSDIPSSPLRNTLRCLDRNIQKFFTSKEAGELTFQKEGEENHSTFSTGVKLDQSNNSIYLPKLGWIGYQNSQEVSGKFKRVTVFFHDGWRACIEVEVEHLVPNIDLFNELVTFAHGGGAEWGCVLAARRNPS